MISYFDFIEDQKKSIRDLFIILDDVFLSYPGTSRKMRYKIPFYDHGKWICYINPLKNKKGVELVFLNGKNLIPDFPILQLKGRKMVAGIEIKNIDQSLLEVISEIFTYSIQ